MHSPLCAYRNMFGAPGTGIHGIRVADIAVVDVVLMLAAAYFVSKTFRISLGVATGSLALAAIICHRVFCVHTTVDRLLFGE